MENYYTAQGKLLRQVFIATEVLFVYLWTPQKKFPPPQRKILYESLYCVVGLSNLVTAWLYSVN